jgi:Acetyltransferase (GNAT) domain
MAVYDNPDFTALPAPLAALFARAAGRSFFSLPVWYHVLSRYGTSKGATARLYADSETRVALVCRLDGPGARRLASLSNYYSTEYGPIYADAGPSLAAGLREIAREIAAARFDAVQLAGLEPNDDSFSCLKDAFAAAGFVTRRYFDSGTWYENTAGMDFARYVEARPAQLRNTWRRKEKALEASKRRAFAYYDDSSRIEEGVAAYERVYAESWKGGEPYPEFMPHLIRAAAGAGALRLGILSVDAIPAAAQCWILWNGRATIYKLAHATRFDDLSPGTILTMTMMERVLSQDRPREVNFGRGDDAFKKSWLGQRRERWGLLLVNRRTLRGRALVWRERAAGVIRRAIGRD